MLLVAARGAYFLTGAPAACPRLIPPLYEDLVRTFYRGLASLEVGLLDDAKRDFAHATDVVAVEPAAWANLALAHLRLGEFEPAAAAVQRAATLAPASSEIAFLQGQLETSRGRLDEGIADFRRAIQLDPASLRARYALAQEVEQAGGPNADVDAQQLLDDLHQRRPDNLAVLLEQTRLAAKRTDGAAAEGIDRRACRRLPPGGRRSRSSSIARVQAGSAAGNFADASRATAFLRNVLVRVPAFRESLVEIKPPSELIAEPFRRFLRLPSPSSDAVAAGRYARVRPRTARGQSHRLPPTGWWHSRRTDPTRPPCLRQAASQLRRIGGAPASMTVPAASGIAVLDWNRDFRMDLALAGKGGVRLLTQVGDGTLHGRDGRHWPAAAARSRPTASACGRPISKWTATSTWWSA